MVGFFVGLRLKMNFLSVMLFLGMLFVILRH